MGKDIVIKEAEMCLFDGIEYLNNYSGSSYVYFRTQKSKEYITVNRSLPSQYMRQKLAINIDRGLEWNWREHSFLPNVKKLQSNFRKDSISINNFISAKISEFSQRHV